MTVLAPTSWAESAVSVDGDTVRVHELAILAPGIAQYLGDQLDLAGPEVTANLLRRALLIGLAVAISTEAPTTLDPHTVNSVLDGFADRVGVRAGEAIREMDDALVRAREAEKSLGETARLVLGGLPEQVNILLAQHLGELAASPRATASKDTAALVELIDASLGELKMLERLRSDAHRAQRALESILTNGQDARENLRVNLIEAMQILRA